MKKLPFIIFCFIMLCAFGAGMNRINDSKRREPCIGNSSPTNAWQCGDDRHYTMLQKQSDHCRTERYRMYRNTDGETQRQTANGTCSGSELRIPYRT